MKYYYSPKQDAIYPGEYKEHYKRVNSWPADATEISVAIFEEFSLSTPPEGYKRGWDGVCLVWRPVYKSPLDLPKEERVWRNAELIRADIVLNKVQDSDPKAVGSVSDWRNYRKSLRAWPEHQDFPKTEFRPKAPDHI